jgi:hypothetical protein
LLTADLVHARRRKGELKLVQLSKDRRERAFEIASQLYDLARSSVGRTREELLDAWDAVRVGPREKKLADGLRKLIDDRLEFEVSVHVDPVTLRREVFELATARRKALREEDRFEREAVLSEVAARHELSREEVETGLYADLKSAHVLREVQSPPPSALVEGYDLEQARAVMLRAVRVTAWIRGAAPGAVRTLFRKLKFQRLLHTITREADGAFRIDIDGPFSLFESVTKYGLQLAIALPAITACGAWEIEADVRWGKKRDPLVFRLAGDARPVERFGQDRVPDRLPDEVETLLRRFEKRKGPWSAAVADEILDLPGVGLCVPDLAFTHAESGEIVLLEVMGFWSRDAVWKRVELVEAGLDRKILFAVSERLRVSEAVLGDDRPGALYVYKGAMSAKQIERALDALVAR